jgi:O-antigen ligase
LFQLCSVFLGGIGVGLDMQLGVPFRAVAYAQSAVFVGNIVAGFFGVGTEPPSEVEAGRYAGLTGNANELAMQLTLGACLVWLFPKKSGALTCLLAVAAVAYAVLTTGSRKALLVLLFFAVLVAVHVAAEVKRRGLRVALLLLMWVLVGAAALAPIVLQNARNVVAVQRALDLEDHSAALRFSMAHQAVRLWKEAPVMGWGTDAFSRISGFGTYAHNNFAELLCDLGLAGCLLFYLIHGYVLWNSRRLARPLNWYCGVFVLMLIALDLGSVSYTRKQTIMILMLLAAVSTSAGKFVKSAARERAFRIVGRASGFGSGQTTAFASGRPMAMEQMRAKVPETPTELL